MFVPRTGCDDADAVTGRSMGSASHIRSGAILLKPVRASGSVLNYLRGNHLVWIER